MYPDQRLRKPCQDMDIGEKAYSGKDRQVIDISDHPGLHNLETLKESGRTCDLCHFLSEEVLRLLLAASSSDRHEPASRDVPSAKDFEIRMRSVNGMSWILLNFNIYKAGHDHPDFVGTRFEVVLRDTSIPKIPLEAVREVPSDPAHPSNLRTIQTWLKTCNENHELCRDLIDPSFVPHRLVDVGSMDAPQLRLEVNSGITYVRYIALSHCWGKDQMLKLDQGNYEAFQKSIPEFSAPKTYRDVVQLARLLNIRYVWIDSLAIKQDDRDDWATQSSYMGQIYKNAYLTIAASCSPADTHGFLHPIRTAAVRCGAMTMNGRATDLFLASFGDEVYTSSNPIMNLIRDEPLTNRGWTVQERILAGRAVFFGSRQCFWQCKDTWAYEDGRTRANDFFKDYRRDQWETVVQDFSKCGLTRPNDRLPALSGIASELASRTGDVYLAGHWLRDLQISLLWRVGGRYETMSRRSPSWSWASVDVEVCYPDLCEKMDVIATVMNHTVRLKDEANPYGEVWSCVLTITAPMSGVELAYGGDEVYFPQAQYIAGSLTVKWGKRFEPNFDTMQLRQMRRIYLAIMMKGKFSSVFHGLLLAPCDDTPGCYERIGVLDQIYSGDGSWDDFLKNETRTFDIR